ncbi:MAG: CRISPR-associated endonuclease Cas2 [Deltaproteobacteria bacterium]|nr:CRISPR-associated endonuclease Cas2 [Deltaproteobacteria bacterium]
MPAATLYLICYDIRDPKRLVRVHKILKARALALQYSVFVLEGTERDKQAAVESVREVIDHTEDDVRVYTLPARVEVKALGVAEPLPSGVLLVGAGGTLVLRARGARPCPAERVDEP